MSATSPETAPVVTVAPPSIAAGMLKGLKDFARRSPLSFFWGVIALIIVLVAIFAPFVAPKDPLAANFRMMGKPPNELAWFGTDQIGRDTLSRVIHGSQASLTVAFMAVLLGTTTGCLWGLASGYFGGRFDIFSQRIIEFSTRRSRMYHLLIQGGKISRGIS